MDRTSISYSQININNTSTGAARCLSFNGKEKDYESGFHYYGARYYWGESLTGWLSVDPMADKYPGISPYAYCAWNPVKLVDPDGNKIKNAYEAYLNISNQVNDLTNRIKDATNREERKYYKKEIHYLLKQHDNYLKIQGAIDAFKDANINEYNRLDQLSYNGNDVDIIINLSDNWMSSSRGMGETNISYRITSDSKVTEIRPINITLYQSAFSGKSNGLSTLANEFGDAIFGTTKPQEAYEGFLEMKNNNTSYWQDPSSRFSFDYEKFIINPSKNPLPNPYDY